MKLVYKILLGLVGVIVLAIAGAFVFGEREMNVERSVVIKAPKPLVYDLVNTLKNWELWSPWHDLDPNMKLTYEGPASGVGASYSWSSKQDNVGSGKLTITAATETIIDNSIDFGDQGTGFSRYTFTPEGDGVKVSWSMKSDMGNFPLIWYFTGVFSDMVAKDFERGLGNLSRVADSLVKVNAASAGSNTGNYKVYTSKVPQRTAFTVRLTCKMAEMSQQLGMAYGGIGKTMQEQGLQQGGAPFAIYYVAEPANDKWEFDAGIPIAGNKNGKTLDNVKAVTLPAADVAVIDYYGKYEEMEPAHNALNDWIKANGKTIVGAPWEEYITDPMTEKDPAKWLSKIYYPIK